MGDGEQRCHGSCQIGGPPRLSESDAWAALSRPQTQCQTSHHRPSPPQPVPFRNLAAEWEYIASHIAALRLKEQDLESFTLVMDATLRADFAKLATPWEKTHSRILVMSGVPDFGSPATPVFAESGMLIAYAQNYQSSGVFRVRVFDVNGNMLSDQSVGELGLADDPVGNELAAAIATLGVSVAVGVARRIASMAMSAAVRSTVRAGASRFLAAIAAIAARVISWRTASGAALERLLKTMVNLQGKDVVRTARLLSGPEVFRHTLTAEIPGVSYARIEKEAALRLSKGAKAHYGEGVYAWPKGATGVGKFIDIEVPKGAAVEHLVVRQANGATQAWFRLVPAAGDTLPVKIVGTNLSKEEIELGRALLK